jgi:hypothetical protein
MGDGGIDEAGSTAMLRRLRALIGSEASEPAPDWREDLRLFAVTWAAGFVFFLIVLA